MTDTTAPVVLLVDEPNPSLLEMLRAIESVNAQVFDAIALPPEMMRTIEDPRRYTADNFLGRQDRAMPALLGMQVHFNKLMSRMPAKVHRKRRSQSWAYHNRIQKKWNKRFGVGPVAVLMNTSALQHQYVNRSTDA